MPLPFGFTIISYCNKNVINQIWSHFKLKHITAVLTEDGQAAGDGQGKGVRQAR